MGVRDTRKKNLQWLIDNVFDGKSVRLAQQAKLEPSQVSRALKLGYGEKIAARIAAAAGRSIDWLDDPNASCSPGTAPAPTTKAAVISPFGHRMVPVVDPETAAIWITASTPYCLSELTEVDWLRSCQGGERTIGIIVETKEMWPDIWPGDAVFVDPEIKPEPGDCVFARVQDESRPILRKYRRVRSKMTKTLQVELVPINEDFPEVVLTTPSDGEVLAVMVEQRKYRRSTMIR